MDDLNLKAIAAGKDEKLFGELVNSRRSWILHTASEACGHYVSESDDEWSVALSAFHEAVKSFDEGKGSFTALAAVVIRRRITDHLRSEGRHRSEIAVIPEAFEGELEEDNTGVELMVQSQIAADALSDTPEERKRKIREEIEEMQELLNAYGFSFFDLTECSPKAEKTKKSCGTAIRTLIASAVLMALMRLKHLLPIKELCEASGVIRKILERHRKYIIASAEILDGDFPVLASYLRSAVKE